MNRLRHQQQPLSSSGPYRPRGLRRIVHPLGPLFRHLPLALRRHLLFLRHRGSWGNFRTPRGFGEKMQWRVLNDRRPLLAWTADKLAQKEYVRNLASSNAAVQPVRIPITYWAGNNSAELRALSPQLPEGWVFKPNHSCGRFRIFGAMPSGTARPDWEELIALTSEWGDYDEEKRIMGHWAYTHSRIAMIAEERIGGVDRPLEIKVLCFGGRAHSLMSQEGIGTDDWRVAYYDTQFNRVNSGWSHELPIHAHDLKNALPPSVRTTLIQAAETLAAPFDFMRVDFYVAENEVWFGELTPYSGGGLVPVSNELDLERGAQWQLPDLAAHDPRAAEWRALLEGPLRGTLQR